MNLQNKSNCDIIKMLNSTNSILGPTIAFLRGQFCLAISGPSGLRVAIQQQDCPFNKSKKVLWNK